MVETPARIEPCGFEGDLPGNLVELATDVRVAAAELGRGLHPESARELRAMVRIMNSYYSNLIEGHNTRPRDIEAALEGRANDVADRPLAEEAAAHVRVQDWIDDTPNEELPEPTSIEFIRELHRRFYDMMPEEFRWIEVGEKRRAIAPGAFRKVGEEVEVGRHMPPSADRLPDFMAHFEMRYRGLTAGRMGQIINLPAAHHRLNYIHPFLDGNGRVSRLMSHAMTRKAGIGGEGLWSISRGLARGLEENGEYKMRMDAADRQRQGDRDGRGNLSLATLEGFSSWFLSVALDQIRFSSAMFDLHRLKDRYPRLVKEVAPDNDRLLKLVDHVVRFGAIDRGDAASFLGVADRTARKDVATGVKLGFLKSSSSRAPVRIGFPLDYRERLFPNLFGTDLVDVPAPPELPGL